MKGVIYHAWFAGLSLAMGVIMIPLAMGSTASEPNAWVAWLEVAVGVAGFLIAVGKLIQEIIKACRKE